MNLNKKICIIFLIVAFCVFAVISLFRYNIGGCVANVIISPVEISLSSGKNFKLNGYETFDSDYTEHNSELSQKLEITEDEAFVLGNLGKYWTKNILQNREIKILQNDLIYYKFSYAKKFENSAFCFKNDKPQNRIAFEKQLNSIRKGKFVILDLDSDKFYPISKENRGILIKQSSL